MKRLSFKLFGLLTLYFIAGINNAYAHDLQMRTEDGDIIYYDWIKNKTELQVTCKGGLYDNYDNEYRGNITIPSSVTYNGVNYSVTRIYTCAFRECPGLKSIIIPSSVTSIGNSAFSDCTGLTNVTIPEGVTSIGERVFSGCTGLTSVTIPESVTNIGSSAFSGCTGLTDINVSVNDMATFCNNDVVRLIHTTINKPLQLIDMTGKAITQYVIPNTVTTISEEAFRSCSRLTSVTIPSSVTSIGSNAFSGCTGLTKAIVPNIAKWCGISFGNASANPLFFVKHIYSDESTEITDLVIPEGVTSISGYALYNCSSLTSVTIPESVTSIGSSAFINCSGLTSVTIPKGVTSIGESVFSGCSGLTSVTIGEGVTSIGAGTFNGCSSLTSVTINSKSIMSKTYTYNTSLIYIFGNQVRNYIIGIGVTSIGNYAFYNCTGLTSVTIPSSVTSIGADAFGNCCLTKVIVPDIAAWCGIRFSNSNANPLYRAKHLYSDENTEITDLTIPSGVTSIGERVFQGCSGLTNVTIPSSVTSIGTSAFLNCTGLTSVTIPSSVTSIGEYAFSGCSGLTSVTIPEGVTSIGEKAFDGCSRLMSVKVHVTDLAAFCNNEIVRLINSSIGMPVSLIDKNGNEITKYVIPSSVTSIGDGAFRGCSGLTSVTIPSSVTSIGKGAFRGCSGLTSVTIPSSVTSIGESAFSGCSGLTSVTIQEGVTSIGEWAFEGCSGLTSVTIPEGVTSLGSFVFYKCTGLTSITIPSSVTSISTSTFSGCSSLTNVTIYSNSILEGGKNPDYSIQQIFGSQVNNYHISCDANIGHFAFAGCSANIFLENDNIRITPYGLESKSRYYCNNGSRTLLECLKVGITPMEIGTGKELEVTHKTTSRTATSLSIEIIYPEHENYSYVVKLYQTADYHYNYYERYVSSYYDIYGTYNTNKIRLTGLEPEKWLYVEINIYYPGGHLYSINSGATHSDNLTFTNLQPKVVSLGNVIVASDINIDPEDEGTNVGFEWRRTDWTDDFPSNTGIAYLYEGTMEGYIRNLNTDKLWKFRPYYLSDSGTYYYGDWMGLDPTNTSYFEPTVHTYAKIEVEGNTALVKGYALNGTDKIAVQGFKYWKSSNKANGMSMAPAKAPAIPGSAQTVEAEGRVMEATLSGLDYETDYSYVAFVKTTEGETFYGDVRSFTTGVNTSGIDTAATTDSSVEVVGIYDLQGHRQNALRPGINIVRYSDGTAKKVMIRR